MSSSQVKCFLDDFEAEASSKLPRDVMVYYQSGAGDDDTARDNRKAFQRYKIIPRGMKIVGHPDVTTSILNIPLNFPVCIAPTAYHGNLHSEGEVATAKGAALMSVPFCISLLSSRGPEAVSAATPDLPKFFNLYPMKDREATVELVRAMEGLGYKAIVLTLCQPTNNKLKVLVESMTINNGTHIELAKKLLKAASNNTLLNLVDTDIDQDYVTWLKSITALPVVVKGILSGECAAQAVEAGADGVLVSNIGGRSLDTLPATMDVLAEVVHAVQGRCEVYLDGGVRKGMDVFKALALGARAVFVGRPAVYALACNGSEGVAEMLRILKDELKAAMAFCGCETVRDIQPQHVKHQSSFNGRP